MTKACLLIAVVDDEEPVRKALMRLMRSAGLNAETFGSGAEFLKSLDTRLPDCVVLDLHMPRMDGFTALSRLADSPLRSTPVIVCTSYALSAEQKRSLAAAYAIVPKHEVSRDGLKALMQTVLAEGSHAR